MTTVLSARALNRATLARQLLLQRATMPELDAIEHLVGLQAQAPLAPYVTLWTRLAGFRPAGLAELLTTRQAVRATIMRGTVHLLSARDHLTLRPLFHPMLTRALGSSVFAPDIAGIDLDELAKTARAVLTEQPRSRRDLGALLAETWPGRDPMSLAYAAQFLVSLVQVTPRGVWGQSSPPAWMATEAWLGSDHDSDPRPDPMVLRYLRAFGPASVMDVQAWSGLTKLREVVERLRPNLITFRNEQGRELFDLPDAPRPDPDTPAPPRFLAEFDNILLSHADRTRVMAADRRVPLPPGNGAAIGTLLIDGRYRADWRIAGEALLIQPFDQVSTQDKSAVEAEAELLLTQLLSGPRTVSWG